MTPEMVKLRRRCEILEAIAAGGMVGEIADRLGVHTSTFYAEVKDHGLPFRASYDARLEPDIKSLHLLASRGFSSFDIAAILQRSKQWVNVEAKARGVKLPRGRLAHMPSRRALLAVASGRKGEQVAGALGVARGTLAAWMRVEGIDLKERNEFAINYFEIAMPEGEAIEPAVRLVPKAESKLSRGDGDKPIGCSAAAISRAMAKRGVV